MKEVMKEIKNAEGKTIEYQSCNERFVSSFYHQIYHEVIIEKITISDKVSDNNDIDFEKIREDITIRPDKKAAKSTEQRLIEVMDKIIENDMRFIIENDVFYKRIPKTKCKIILDGILKGERSESSKDVLSEYLSKMNNNIAQYIASHITSLWYANYGDVRTKELGLTKYTWRYCGGGRYPCPHEHLDGKIFDYDNPPVVCERTGEKANPGECLSFICMCSADAIIDEDLLR